MEIQMLGTGSAFAKHYYNNNALIYAGDFQLMVDCGTTAAVAMHALDKPLDTVDALLITHIHADHVGGVEEFAYRMKYQYKQVKKLYIAECLVNPLWEHSLRGGLEQEESQSLSDYFEVLPLRENTPYTLAEGLTVELLRTPHIPNKPSFSLYFNNRFFYSADMQFSPQLLQTLVAERGCQQIFHDCQLQSPGVVHASLEELLTLPPELQERIHLMHYADDRSAYEGRTGRMRFVEQHHIYKV